MYSASARDTRQDSRDLLAHERVCFRQLFVSRRLLFVMSFPDGFCNPFLTVCGLRQKHEFSTTYVRYPRGPSTEYYHTRSTPMCEVETMFIIPPNTRVLIARH